MSIHTVAPRLGTLGAALLMALACHNTPPTAPGAPADDNPEEQNSAPPGVDTLDPFPIDRGDDGAGTPGTYKGLWLRLTDNDAPTVTPVDGVIGVVCIGMSNASQECSEYVNRVGGAYAPDVNPAVRVVNCAVGGNAIERWNDAAFDGTLWDDCVARKLPNAGVRADQVRVVYHKAANQFTTGAGGAALPRFPDAGSDYANFYGNLGTFAARVAQKLPSVQAVYTSSRSYGGYSGNPGRGEPLSYEEGHALNTWLRDNAAVGSVWYGWGPYLWAPACSTGVVNASNVCYDRQDYVDDGVHPSTLGRAKVAAMIHQRLLRESWYRRAPTQ